MAAKIRFWIGRLMDRKKIDGYAGEWHGLFLDFGRGVVWFFGEGFN
jgi:hypothetical protein